MQLSGSDTHSTVCNATFEFFKHPNPSKGEKMKQLTIPFFCLLFFGPLNSCIAQFDPPMPNWHFMDHASVPAPRAEMPEHVKLLYTRQEVSMRELQGAFAAYYEQRGWDRQMDDLEHDPYAKFFHQWYQAAQNFIDNNGNVKALSTTELLQHRRAAAQLEAAIENNKRIISPSGSWSFVGPKRTIWRSDHRADQPTAPWQVNIYSLAVAPSDPSVLYCGSETGVLYKSTDKGLNWTAFNDFNWGRAILSVAIHPTNPDIVYAASSTDIFKTIDAGKAWSIVYTESGLSCNSLAINPSMPDTIFAGTAKGLKKSVDGGANWTTLVAKHIDDIQYRPHDGTTLYALARTGTPDTYTFYKSTDSGTTFLPRMTGWGTIYEQSGGRISVSPANPNYIYAVLLTHDGTGNATKPYIMKSIDNAANWLVVATGNTTDCPLNNGQGYYDLDIVASHTNAEHLIAATTTAYKSTDGGQVWTAIGGYSGDFAIHPDIQEMVSIHDGTTENTWITTDGGVNFSIDFYTSTDNWEARIDGLDGTSFWGFAQGWNEDYIIGGRYHNGNTVIHENYPDKRALRLGGAESVTGWAMHGRERYAAFDDIAELILPTAITDAPQGSFLFTKHPQNYYYGDAFSRVMVDFEDFMTIYLGQGNSFWRSKDGGASWNALHNFAGKPYHFDFSRANPDYIYLAADDGFYRSTNRGATFSEMSLPPGLTDWHSQNLRVAASSSDPNVVWVLNHRSGPNSTAGRVFKSIDGGSSWIDWTTASLAGRKWVAIAHQAATNGGIYIASNRGEAGTMPAKVMYRNNSMSDWADFSDGLPKSANPIKLLPFYRDGKLRWGGNRAAWEIDFFEQNWSPMAQPFVSGKMQICVRDTVEFDSYSIAKGTASFNWSIPGASWTSGLDKREVKALFPADGTYTATLTVMQNGQMNSKSVDVIVNNECDAEQIPGNALSLSGQSSDYAATGKALDITTNTLTISAWLKRDGTQNPYAGIVFMRNGTASGLNFRENNELGFHWNNSEWWWSSGLIVPDNEWAHVAMVVSPTQTTLYLNGVPAVNSADPALCTFDGVMNFGADPNWLARRFKGEMDEVLIYNRALSQNEIRELMHLTRQPAAEVDLIGYWQFNRTEGTITDRVATRHASLIGAAARTTSLAPVGPGESSRIAVSTSGTYTFGTTDLTLVFPAGGTAFPNGEICVTRIDHAPDQLPAMYVTAPYWIVHNYGGNTTFDELTSLTFNNIEISMDEAANPANLRLFKRASNAHGNSWGGEQDTGDAATAGSNGSATFSSGNGQTSFSQYIIARTSAPLDADLLLFEAWLNRKQEVELNWISSSEEQLLHYELQRSKDGYHFDRLALVESLGNSSAEQKYQAVDKAPLRGISYYRLKMVDEDGSFEYSELRSIVHQALADQVILYPNPLKRWTKLQVKTQLSEAFELIVYSAKGEQLGAFTLEGDSELSLGHLPKGLYSCLIQTADWKKVTRIVID